MNSNTSNNNLTLTAISNDSLTMIPTIPPLHDRLTIAAIYFVFSAVAIALHIVVAVAIVRSTTNRMFHSFHILTMHLYSADLLTFVVYAFYACPSILVSYRIYGALGDRVMGAFQTAGFIASVTITFCISLNRALAIWQHAWNKRAFSSRNCWAIGIGAWVLGGLTMIFNYYVDCYTIFDEKYFNFKTVCYSGTAPLYTPSSIAIYVGVYGVGVVYVYAAYGLYKRYIGVELERVQQAARAHRTRLLVQAFFIWLSLVANVLAFRIVNTFISGKWAVVTAVLVVFWSRAVPPMCMLVLARDIRSRVAAMFGRKISANSQVTPLQQEGATRTQRNNRSRIE